MNTPLNLFPARIRWCNADGTLTPEALRMLQVLVQRVGGVIGDAGEDTFAVLATGSDAQHASFDALMAPAAAAPAPDGGMVNAPASTPPALVDQILAPANVLDSRSTLFAEPVLMQPSAPAQMFETTYQGSNE